MKTKTTTTQDDKLTFSDYLRLGVCPRCCKRALAQDRWVCLPCLVHFQSIGELGSDQRTAKYKAAKRARASKVVTA